MPVRPVIGGIAVIVLVIEWRVVEIGMGGDGERQDAGALGEAHRLGIDLGRPDIGFDLGALELAGRFGLDAAGRARDFHGEFGEAAIGYSLGLGDVEGRLDLAVALGGDVMCK